MLVELPRSLRMLSWQWLGSSVVVRLANWKETDMKINRLVLDLSHHETVQDWQAVKDAGIEGLIWKATQGQSYHDDTYHKCKAKALEHGFLWGSYHFADGTSVSGQVNNYYHYARPEPGELFCLDLEDNPDGTAMNLAQAREFVEKIENLLGRPNQCVVYSGNTLKEMLGNTKSTFWGARRMWLAQYGTNPSVQKSWDTYWLWQYSDGEYGPQPHDVAGISDAVDSNSFDGTPEELAEQWSGNEPTPAPGPEPSPDLP